MRRNGFKNKKDPQAAPCAQPADVKTSTASRVAGYSPALKKIGSPICYARLAAIDSKNHLTVCMLSI
jgi:hypothetical protein